MNVLHVINTGEVGGGGTHLRHLVPGLADHGFHSVVAVGRGGSASDQLRAMGIMVHVLGPMGLSASWRLASLYRSVRPDLLHLHGSRAGLLGTLAAMATDTAPVVYTAHAFAFKRPLPPPLGWAAARADALTCARADGVICLTAADVRAAAARAIALPHASVIANGIDVARFTAGRGRREEFGFEANVPVVGMVARLVPDKDPLTFVRAAGEIVARIAQARFLLVGDGPLRNDVEALVQKLGLAPRFVLTGFRIDVPNLLASMDIVLLTSRWEGMPVSVLEAMAAGRPVVASALPGLSEVLKDGPAGILVPPGAPDAFADAVQGLLGDRRRAQAMGRNGRARVMRDYTVTRMVEATVAVYRRVLAPALATALS